jgi:hypothetical protein
MNGTIVGISELGGAFYRDVPPGAYSAYAGAPPLGSGILSGERVERRLAAILAADVRGFAFNAWASPAG